MLADSLLISFFITTGSVVIVCMCLDVFMKRRFLKKCRNSIPVLPYLPIVGNALSLAGRDVLATINGWSKRMPGPFFMWIFYLPHYITCDPAEIKEILTNPNTLGKSFAYKLLKPIFKNSLLTAEVNIWKKNRRILTRCFPQKVLENSVPIIDKLCDQLIDKIRSENNENCSEQVERFSVSAFVETLCNLKMEEAAFDTSKFLEFDFYKYIKMAQRIIVNRFVKPWYYPDIIFFNSKEGKKFDNIIKHLDTILINAVEDRKRILQEEKDASTRPSSSVFNVMIEDNMSTEDIVAEIKFWGAASGETAGASLPLALMMLAVHPDIQEKVLAEVLEVVGPDGPVKYQDVLNLKYTEMVIEETLRIIPPVSYIHRTTAADVDIGGKILPKGTNIILDIFGVHRSEKYWKDPLKFNPDRFLPSEVDKRPPFTYLPFSLGPRNCLGAKYSMIVMKIALAKIIRSYRVSSKIKSIEDIEARADVTVRIENVNCTFTPR